MKIIAWEESKLVGGSIVARVECEQCGHVGSVLCDSLSELHHSVCSKCGHVNVERKDGQLYKDTKKLLGNVGTERTSRVEREGLEKLIRIYYELKADSKLDLEAFPNKEEFVRWAVNAGYRDWKSIRAQYADSLIDKNAYWEVGGYGVKGYSNKKTATMSQGKTKIAKSFGNCLRDSIKGIDAALVVADEEIYRWGIEDEGHIDEMKGRLSRVKAELKDLEVFLDAHF